VLADKGVTRRAFDAIVCSGDLALAHIAEAGYASIHRIGPMPRDASFFDRLPGPHAEISTADAIACTGLAEDRRQSAEDYRQLLEQALARRLPLVCANPDLAVHVGADLLPCAGAVAALYESLGGPVVWAGKPHAGAFRRAHEVAEGLRRTAVPKARILAIGDALRTDLAAAERHGIDALFVAAGIHRHEVMAGDAIDPEGLARLFAGGGPSALAATAGLVW
jgi:HAD superfamily hydrolase (TIGR01459 family)